VLKGMMYGDGGAQALYLGFEQEDITHLLAGHSYHMSPQAALAMGLPEMELIICYGRTEGDLLDALRSKGLAIAGLPKRPEGT
jgi:hypothetical protein